MAPVLWAPVFVAQLLFASALDGGGAESSGSNCSTAQCSDDDEAASMIQVTGGWKERRRWGWTQCNEGLSSVSRCLEASARNLVTSLPNVTKWSDGDDEGFSGAYVDNGIRDMFDQGNYLSISVTGLGFSQAIEYTQQCDGSWSFSGFGDVEYFTCRVDVENATVWFAGFRSKSGSINGFKVGGELGSDEDGFGVVGRTMSPREGFYGYYSQTKETNDPSVNHLVIVPDSKWTEAYTTNPDLRAEGDIYTAPGYKKCILRKGAPVHGFLYVLWGGDDNGIPSPRNTEYSQADFQKALDSIMTTC